MWQRKISDTFIAHFPKSEKRRAWQDTSDDNFPERKQVPRHQLVLLNHLVSVAKELLHEMCIAFHSAGSMTVSSGMLAGFLNHIESFDCQMMDGGVSSSHLVALVNLYQFNICYINRPLNETIQN